jgi:hypothetical protein
VSSAFRRRRENERRMAVQRYSHLYSRAPRFDFDKCAYCGSQREHLDHCPPFIWVYSLGSAYFTRAGIEFLIYPSCAECNRLLSDHRLFSFKERLEFLEAALKKKYKRFRKAVMWEDHEIEEISGRMRDAVEDFKNVQVVTDRRLETILELKDGFLEKERR